MPLPAQSSSIDQTYGGIKQNQDNEGIVDPEFGADAAEWNNLVSDVSQMTRVGCQAMVQWDGYGSNPGNVTLHNAWWGNSDSVKPTVTWNGTYYLVTLPASVESPLGETVSINIAGFFATNWFDTDGVGSELDLLINCKKISSNSFRVFVRGDDGALAGAANTIQVVVW